MKYPSHGYRWLNAKIHLDIGAAFSDPYAHKCCKIAGIKAGQSTTGTKSQAIQEEYSRICFLQSSTLTDLWNNEIVSHALLAKRVDRMTYISGLKDLLELKKAHTEYKMILHSDQGSVYASKAYNELLPMYVNRSMTRAGTPTDNAAMESINGWIKAKLFMDLHVTGKNQ